MGDPQLALRAQVERQEALYYYGGRDAVDLFRRSSSTAKKANGRIVALVCLPCGYALRILRNQ